MIIVEPSVTPFHATPNAERVIEYAARKCYQSSHRIIPCPVCKGEGASLNWAIDPIGQMRLTGKPPCIGCDGMGSDIVSARKIIKHVLARGHDSVMEHVSIGFSIITDRGVTHEMVRHRIGVAFSQESTRFCNYSLENDAFCGEITVLEPPTMTEEQAQEWREAMVDAERHYNRMSTLGAKPEISRSVLPNSLKAEIATTMNFRSWRHFLELRDSEKAHPQMRQVAQMVKAILRRHARSCFEDLPL